MPSCLSVHILAHYFHCLDAHSFRSIVVIVIRVGVNIGILFPWSIVIIVIRVGVNIGILFPWYWVESNHYIIIVVVRGGVVAVIGVGVSIGILFPWY